MAESLHYYPADLPRTFYVTDGRQRAVVRRVTQRQWAARLVGLPQWAPSQYGSTRAAASRRALGLDRR